MKPYTFTLSGLAGLPGQIEAAHIKNASQAIKFLSSGFVAVSTAGDRGAINVWKRDKQYSCERCVYGAAADTLEATSLRQVRDWLKINLPKI